MKKVFVALLGVAFLCCFAVNADAVKNANGKFALHNAGTHNAKTHTCAFVMSNCMDINTNGGIAGERNDIYVLAIDVVAISGVRYGICCDGTFFFYGWTKCTDFEIPQTGWLACGKGNAQTWSVERPGPNVTVGIIDVFLYASSHCMCICNDPRVGFAEFCDGSQPSPICYRTSDPAHFGCVAFNGAPCGYNPCSIVPTEETSWGAVKSLYR